MAAIAQACYVFEYAEKPLQHMERLRDFSQKH
jgi:hypothetical protein